MTEATADGRFVLDLPDSDAALALAGAGEQTLHRLQALTGASVVMRGLQLVIGGRPAQLERAAALVELIRPLWQEGQAVSAVDLQAALTALD
ncbi:MAG: phosphate starvation-inducible protein PhoH, partial [Prochlorococcus sp.]